MKFENTYLDVNVIPELQFSKDFYLQAGISYSQFLFSRRIKTSGETKSGVKRFDNGKFNSEINIVTGIEFKLQRNTNFEFNYFVPTSKKNTNNFQLSLNILLNNKAKKQRYIKINRNRSKEQIAHLKNGTLLVRLKTSENKINALLKSGETEEADKVRKQQKIENKKIVLAFRHYYNFADILFFYNNKSYEIRKKEFNGVFLNDSLSIDSSIAIDKSKPIFIAEFAAIEQDTAKYFSHSTYEPDGNWSVKKVNHYYGGPNPGFDALVIRNENFTQLKKPFPYYTRAIFNSVKQHPEQVLFSFFILPFQNWSYNKTVKRMNVKLFNYYEKTSRQ